MSHTHDIDNDPEALFQFDSYEPLAPPNHLEVSAREPSPSCSRDLPGQSSLYSSPLPPQTPQELSLSAKMMDVTLSEMKGKGVSQPLIINPRAVLDTQDDLFSMSLSSSSSSVPTYEQLPDLSLSPSSFDLHPLQTPTFLDHDLSEIVQLSEDDVIVEGSLGKGKAKELPPTLPPLSLFSTDIHYQSSTEWSSLDLASSPVAGPSSYGSGFASIAESEELSSAPTRPHVSVPTAPEPTLTLARMPSRRRSLSHLSTRSNSSTLPALTMTRNKIRAGVQKAPSNFARKLLFKKRESAPATPTSPTSGSSSSSSTYNNYDTIVIDTEVAGCVDLGQGNCFMPWARDFKSRASPLVSPMSDIDNVLSTASPILPIYRTDGPSTVPNIRTKGRSYSSPLPLSASPLEIVPVSADNIFTPVHVILPNYFDDFLPRELRLHVLVALVELHEAEHQRNVRSEKWTTKKATRSKWVGRDKGIKELLKLSEVGRLLDFHCT